MAEQQKMNNRIWSTDMRFQEIHDLVWDAMMSLWTLGATKPDEDRERLVDEVETNLKKIDDIVRR